ncbi:hypothetical protein SteCoe_36017 [Stentor coeruleus]|uniref:Uncharacterized protein n=1 Tax=Stentor coeruleus TaxID=5963 RepID=A0A1R2AR46_9CILI|nr:hypothetical protein SteCoe_36017 [Stentor coeruleus]
MMIRLTRGLSSITQLKELSALAEKEFTKKTKDFISAYEKYIEKNSEDIYCYSLKITPSQQERADMVANEILSLSPLHFRALVYLSKDSEKRNFNYQPHIEEKENTGEDIWSQGIWPSIHPTNLEFQKEIEEFGLLGHHGLPKAFIEKLLAGETLTRN